MPKNLFQSAAKRSDGSPILRVTLATLPLPLRVHQLHAAAAPFSGFLIRSWTGVGSGLAADGPGGAGVLRPLLRRRVCPGPEPASPPPPVDLLTAGAVAPTGPQLACSGQSRRFFAALMSRSTGSPVIWQMSCLASLAGAMSRHPQPWWIWLEGYQRSPVVTFVPGRARL